jgi:hypothetical protein
MKRIGVSICAVMFVAALGSSCVAQDNPWNGSWKIDAATMKYDGPTLSVAVDADGFTITQGGKANPKVVCDGQPQKQDSGMMTTCTKTADGYAIESTKDGKTATKATISLSPDGEMATRKVEVFPSDGSPFTVTSIRKRVSGGPGLAGVWKETSFSESLDTGILAIKVEGDSVAFKETDQDTPNVCKLDGTPTTILGTRLMTAKLDGPRTLKVTYSDKDGKVERANTFVLSANGKTVKETDVTPEPSPSTMSVMFHKE